MPLSPNVEMICKMMQLRMDIGKAGFSPATCLSDIKDLERIREVIESYEAVVNAREYLTCQQHIIGGGPAQAKRLAEARANLASLEDKAKSSSYIPGYQADIELTCPEGELDRNPAFKTLFNTIEDAVNTYLESGPKSSPEITVRFNGGEQ